MTWHGGKSHGGQVTAGVPIEIDPIDIGPIDIDRDAARDAARDELAKPIYDEAQPPFLTRAGRWLLEQVDKLINQIGDATPGGWWALIVLLGVLAVAAYVVRRGAGPLRRTVSAAANVFDGRALTAAEHRLAADAARSRADWSGAVRDRFRAVVRTLEERGVLDEHPGRTADEAAAEAGQMLPVLARRLRSGARVFDEVVYGAHEATREHDDELQALDEAVRTERLAVAGR